MNEYFCPLCGIKMSIEHITSDKESDVYGCYCSICKSDYIVDISNNFIKLVEFAKHD